jgi:hypothetical protein
MKGWSAARDSGARPTNRTAMLVSEIVIDFIELSSLGVNDQ